MCKVYLYSRVSTSAQTLAQQERTAYEWLNAHHMKVDEVVSDEGVSGGVSYAERNLGKVLLPKTQEGDMIIVSEISRLGRSMFDLSKLIHTELKPRKLRLVVCNMGIDLNCSKMTAIDELILNNFSFAAQLEKQLISERTLSALQVKKKQGVKLGGAASKWRESFNAKSDTDKANSNKERGKSRSHNYLERKDTQAFFKVLRNVFPAETALENPKLWQWNKINTKGTAKEKMLSLMHDYHDFDGTLFEGWNFSEKDNVKMQVKLSGLIGTIKRSVMNYYN